MNSSELKLCNSFANRTKPSMKTSCICSNLGFELWGLKRWRIDIWNLKAGRLIAWKIFPKYGSLFLILLAPAETWKTRLTRESAEPIESSMHHVSPPKSMTICIFCAAAYPNASKFEPNFTTQILRFRKKHWHGRISINILQCTIFDFDRFQIHRKFCLITVSGIIYFQVLWQQNCCFCF